MNMATKKDKAPGVRIVGKRPGGGTPEVSVASGGTVSASPRSKSGNYTQPCPPCSAGGGKSGTASARIPEMSKDTIAPGMDPKKEERGVFLISGSPTSSPKRRRKVRLSSTTSGEGSEAGVQTILEIGMVPAEEDEEGADRCNNILTFMKYIRKEKSRWDHEIQVWIDMFLEVEEELEKGRTTWWRGCDKSLRE